MSADGSFGFNSHSRRPRRGVSLIVALVCVAVAGVLMFSLVRLAALNREVVGAETRQLQARWLAESGLERAAARLAADPKYPGETWTISAESMHGQDAAVVRIEVEKPADKPAKRIVRVQADFPDHPYLRARESREAVFDNKE